MSIWELTKSWRSLLIIKRPPNLIIRKVFAHFIRHGLNKTVVVMQTSKRRSWKNSSGNSLHIGQKRSDLVPNVEVRREYQIQLRYFPTT